MIITQRELLRASLSGRSAHDYLLKHPSGIPVIHILHSFEDFRLVEGMINHLKMANIMVNNERSKKVVRSLGFTYEGTSPNYLFIRGRWEDHEHYVFLNRAWKSG